MTPITPHTTFNISRIRAEFPLIDQGTYCYLDNAATTQKPKAVIRSIQQYYQNHNANVHRGVHDLSDQTTAAFENARKTLQRFINAQTWQEIVWTKGATEAINLIAYSWGQANITSADTILISAMEHHANIVPWQQLAIRTGAKIEVIALTESGDIDIEDYQRSITQRPKIVALTQISNVLGTLNPIKQLTALAHEAGAIVAIDGAQALAHERIDVQDINCDFYVASAHKAYGPTGIGFLYGKQSLLETMPPWQFGGEMIDKVSFEKTTFNAPPFKFEAGTPPIAESIGFAAALDFLNNEPLLQRQQHEEQCMSRLVSGLQSIPTAQIVGNPKNRRALVAFNLDDIHSYDIGQLLNQQRIAVRTGHHCAMPLMDLLGFQHGCVRASLGIYNTLEEIDNLLEVIEKISIPKKITTTLSASIKTNEPTPLISHLKTLHSWQDKLNYLTMVAKENPSTNLADDDKTPKNQLHGCTSQVWLLAQQDANSRRLTFTLDSNSKIIKGLASIILEAVNRKTPQEIIALDIEMIFTEVGLKQHLSPSRSNGLTAIAHAIKHIANTLT